MRLFVAVAGLGATFFTFSDYMTPRYAFWRRDGQPSMFIFHA